MRKFLRDGTEKKFVLAMFLLFCIFAQTPSLKAQVWLQFYDNHKVRNSHEVAVNPTVSPKAREAALKSVVNVIVYRWDELSGSQVPNTGGSGFVIGKNLVMLAAHEVMVEMGNAVFFDKQHTSFQVLTESGSFNATVEYINACEDLAILRVESDLFDKEPVIFEQADVNAKPNMPWFAVGFPEMYYMRVAKFDSLNGTKEFSFGGNCWPVKWGLTEGIRPGYSGGPIFDKNGAVRGLISMMEADRTGYGLNSIFIPVPRIMKFLENFRQFMQEKEESQRKEDILD